MTSSISPYCYYYILHMRLFTRQRRELNDDCCDVSLSYYDNCLFAAIFARVVARVAYYIINTTKCATAACCSTRAPDAADDVVNLAALLLLHTTYICAYSRDSVAS
jgi:hypothetical protein